MASLRHMGYLNPPMITSLTGLKHMTQPRVVLLKKRLAQWSHMAQWLQGKHRTLARWSMHTTHAPGSRACVIPAGSRGRGKGRQQGAGQGFGVAAVALTGGNAGADTRLQVAGSGWQICA